jgi:hypothetical protein
MRRLSSSNWRPSCCSIIVAAARECGRAWHLDATVAELLVELEPVQ